MCRPPPAFTTTSKLLQLKELWGAQNHILERLLLGNAPHQRLPHSQSFIFSKPSLDNSKAHIKCKHLWDIDTPCKAAKCVFFFLSVIKRLFYDMNNWRFVNCIDISLIFQCILLPLFLHFWLPSTLIWTKSTFSSDRCKYLTFLNHLPFILCRENTGMKQSNVLFCCIVHFICAESVTQWIWWYKAIFSVELFIHALWFPVISVSFSFSFFYESAIQYELLGAQKICHSSPIAIV